MQWIGGKWGRDAAATTYPEAWRAAHAPNQPNRKPYATFDYSQTTVFTKTRLWRSIFNDLACSLCKQEDEKTLCVNILHTKNFGSKISILGGKCQNIIIINIFMLI